MQKTLFLCGAKKSGTSLLVRLLNQHPDISITSESDIIWILFQIVIQKKTFNELKSFRFDGCKGMNNTLRRFKDIIKSVNDLESAKAAFLEIQKSAEIMGDKKPSQYCSPKIIKFILKMFPDAKFLSIVRHPQAACYSNFLRTGKKNNIGKTTKRYKWVAANLEAMKDDVPFYTFKYEDLCLDPQKTLDNIFEFLEVSSIENNIEIINVNHKYAGMKIDQDILDLYGYEAY